MFQGFCSANMPQNPWFFSPALARLTGIMRFAYPHGGRGPRGILKDTLAVYELRLRCA